MPPRAAPSYATWPDHRPRCSQLGGNILPHIQALYGSVCSAPDATNLAKLVEHVTKLETRDTAHDAALTHLLVVVLMTQDRPLRKMAVKALSQLHAGISSSQQTPYSSSSSTARNLAHAAIGHHIDLWLHHMTDGDGSTAAKAAAFALGLVNLLDEYPQPLLAHESADAREKEATATLAGRLAALVRRSKVQSLASGSTTVVHDIAVTKCFISLVKFAPSVLTQAALDHADPMHDDVVVTVSAVMQSLSRYSLERDAACMEAMAIGMLLRLICHTPSCFVAVTAKLLGLSPGTSMYPVPSSLEWLALSPPALSETVSIAILRALLSVVDHCVLFKSVDSSHPDTDGSGSIASVVVFPELQRLCVSTIDAGNRYALLGSVNQLFALALDQIKDGGKSA